MGHSNGGAIALHYACAHPDRVHGLIVVDSPVQDTSRGEGRAERMRLRKGSPGTTRPWLAGVSRRTRKRNSTPISRDHALLFSSIDNLDKHRDVFDQTSSSFHAHLGQQHSQSSWGDLVSALPRLDTPTLIVAGADDFLYPPSAAQAMHDRIARSKLLMIEHAGHFPWLEQPGPFFEGIRELLPELGYQRG